MDSCESSSSSSEPEHKKNRVEASHSTSGDEQLPEKQANGSGDQMHSGSAGPVKNGVEPDSERMAVKVETSEYFSSYEDLNVHRLMLKDTVRTNAYLNAINIAADLFKDKVVMDIGAGTGILSLFCAKAGAQKVFAVEASNLAAVLPGVVEDNGFTDIITVIHSKVEDIAELPGCINQVDIIISEWMGFYLLHESMLDSVVHARDKFLKPDGHMFPNSAQIYAAPCSAADVRQDNIEFWCSKEFHYGLDLSRFGSIAKNVGKPLIETIPAENLLSDPQLLFDMNLKTISAESLQTLKDRRFFSIEQTGEMHAVCIWFTCTFPVVPNSEPVELSTAPWSEATHWKQTLILLPEKLEFEEGDITGWELTFEKADDEKGCRSYRIQYQCLDADDEHPIPCDCGMVKCEIIKQYMTQQPNE